MQQIEPVKIATLKHCWNIVWLEESKKVDSSQDYAAWYYYLAGADNYYKKFKEVTE